MLKITEIQISFYHLVCCHWFQHYKIECFQNLSETEKISAYSSIYRFSKANNIRVKLIKIHKIEHNITHVKRISR